MARRRAGGETLPPERLTDGERFELDAWVTTKPELRWARKHLVDLEEECFDHFRSTGELGRDWLATVRVWIRNRHNWNDTRRVAAESQPQARREWKAPDTGNLVKLTPEMVRAARPK